VRNIQNMEMRFVGKIYNFLILKQMVYTEVITLNGYTYVMSDTAFKLWVQFLCVIKEHITIQHEGEIKNYSLVRVIQSAVK
jgi:hypothetical protein